MVDHDQQRVKAGGKGKVGDQVTGNLLEGVRRMGLDQGEWGNGGVRVRLVLLACGTALNIFAHKMCETRPPKFGGDKLASLEIARVTCSLVVVTVGEDGAVKGLLWEYVDTTLVGQDVIIELLV